MTALAEDLTTIGWTPAELARRIGGTAQVADRWARGMAEAPPVILAWVADLAQAHRERPAPEGWRRLRGVRPSAPDP